MKQQARFLKAFAWNHAGRLIEYCLIYCFSVLIARKLGAYKNGEYAVFLSITQFFLIVSSLGLETSITANFPKLLRETSPENIGGIFRHLLTLRLAGILIVGVVGYARKDLITWLFHIPETIGDLWFILIVYFSFRSVTSLLASFQIAKIQTATTAVINVGVRSLELIGAYLLLANGYGLREVLLFIMITGYIQMTGYLISLKELFKGTVPASALKPVRKMSTKFWLNSLIEFILGRQTDILLLSYFVIGSAMIGQYDVASGFASLINIGLTTGFYGLLIRSFSTLEVSKPESLAPYWEFLTRAIIVLIIPVFIATAYYAGTIIPLIYSSNYAASIRLFQVFSVFLIATRIMGGGIAADYLQAAGKVNVLLLSSLASGLTNLVLAFILIPTYGAIGAVYATGAAALVIAAMHGYYSGKLLPIRFPLGTGLTVIAVSLLSVLLLAPFQGGFPKYYFSIFLILFESIVLALCYLAKPFTMRDVEFLDSFPPRLLSVMRLFARYPCRVTAQNGKKYFLSDRHKYAYWWTPQSGVLLDIGSSDSIVITALAGKAGEFYAVDEDEEALHRLSALNKNITVSKAPAEKLPFSNNMADTVLFLDVLEHTQDDRRAIDEIDRVLKPGGTLILSVPNKGLFRFLDPQNLAAKVKGTFTRSTEHRHYSEAEIFNLLGGRFRLVRKHAGGLFLYPISFYLSHASRKYLKRDWGRFFKTIGDFDNDISWGPLSYNLILQLEKI